MLYRLLMILALPAWAAVFAWRLARGREGVAELRERLGGRRGVRPEGPVIWLHGASLGEMAAARPLIDEMLARLPALEVIATVNTCTARKMLHGWGEPRLHARLAPLDYPFALRRFLRHWQPAAALTLENEIWPQRLAECAAAGVPVLVAAGRMSARSAALWGRFPRLARRTMEAIAFLAPLDEPSGRRFAALGLPPERIGAVLNLKAAALPPPPDSRELAALAGVFPRDRTILAASTHQGEEEVVLEAFATALAQRPDLRLILAPRHPERAPRVARLIEARGLHFARRSETPLPPAHAPVFLADTTGEMALWYAGSGLTFIGGTLGARGGHTPFEPAAFGSRIIHGPDTANHAAAFAALHEAGAATEVADAPGLARAMAALAGAAENDAIAQAARRALQELTDRQASPAELLATLARLAHLPALAPSGRFEKPGGRC